MGLFHFYCSVAKSCTSPCDLMDCSTPDFPSFPHGLQHTRERWIEIHHYLLEFAETHVHWVSDDIQSSHPLSPPSPPGLSLSQHQSLFQWVGSLCQVAKVLELQRQSFQWWWFIHYPQITCLSFKNVQNRDFPVVVVKTPCYHCKGCEFHPWSGN